MQSFGSTVSPYELAISSISYNNITPSPADRSVKSVASVLTANTVVFLTVGQSLVCNYASGSFSPASDNIYQVNIRDGGLYDAADPTLGVDGTQTNFAIRLADKIIVGGKADTVIFIPIGMGGSSVSQWGTGGEFNHRIGVGIRRLSALGLTPNAVLWQQGTTDTSLATTQAVYAARLSEVIAAFRANAPVNTPVFVAQESWVSGTLSLPIKAAQVAAVNPPAFIYSGPDIDTITERQDATHLNAVGANQQAQLWYDKISVHLP
ncbi:sialate O-acetylesterase [Brucella lupini]|uniref:Sialate O-acetylesterase n=1 Tax=Brucella lupini TaxID=255457 RepID=A0AB34DE15_9HYPH|nr:sialate O-acetylesterase [Brucella lupini]KAB2701306.1 sialate O-acetylesterase [Brucella lupini]